MDIEEAKGQEIAKLQTALQEMHEKLDEAQEAIIREKEAARIAIEQAPPVIKEVPVVDNTKLDLLTSRNKELEVRTSKHFVVMSVQRANLGSSKLKMVYWYAYK